MVMKAVPRFVGSILTATVLVLLAGSSARADFLFYLNNPSGYQSELNTLGIVDTNIVYNQPGLVTTGNPVQGQSVGQGNVIISFSSNETLTTPSKGQARVSAADDSFKTITITPFSPPSGFLALSFNVNPAQGVVTGTIDVTYVDQFGNSQVAKTDVSPGLVFFGAIGTKGEVITSATLESTAEIADIREVKVAVDPAAVPEPASVMLLAVGMACGGICYLRKRRHS